MLIWNKFTHQALNIDHIAQYSPEIAQKNNPLNQIPLFFSKNYLN